MLLRVKNLSPMDTTSPSPSPPRRSLIVRFFRSRILRGIVFVIFCLVTLAFLVLAEENWRGRHAWEKFRQEWEAKGERLDFASFIPQPVPDDQNFFMAPIWAGLRGKKWDPKTGEIKPGDPNVPDRLPRKQYAVLKGMPEGPRDGYWEINTMIELKPWQEYYRRAAELTNLFPVPPQAREPAEDVLMALSINEPGIEELRQASQRAYARYPINYDAGFDASTMSHLAEFKACVQVLKLRAISEEQAGQAGKALADVKLLLYLDDSIRAEPYLVSHLVRIACTSITMQPVWEGLGQHRWSDAQLAELGEALAKEDFLADYQFVMRGERAFSNEMMAQYRTGRVRVNDSEPGPPKMMRVVFPTGWFYQNQLVINRLHQEFTLSAVDAAQHRVYPEKCGTNVVASALGKRTPYNIFAWMLFPAYGHAAERFARTQTSVDLATVACALERFRLANGKYPEALDTLTPQFIAKLPTDVINGQPLKYRLDESGQPVIYSVGWNQMDDGGIVGLTTGSHPKFDPSKGDWVWRYPAK